MKKLLITLALVFAVSALFGEKPKFEVIKPAKTVTVKNMPAFVEHKLPAMISLKSPLFKGTIRNSNTISGTAIHRVSWSYNGIPVVGKFTVIKEKDGKILSIINGLKDFSLDTKPVLSAEKAALSLAKRRYGNSIKDPDFISKLVIISYSGSYRLAYRVRFRPSDPLDGRFFFVDANTGKLLRSGSLIRKATNKAKVFEMNPIRTPDPIEIELPWVADDAEGKLSAAADDKGLRRIAAANCPDLGETASYYDQEYPVCTVKQLANKEENGSFIYEDWTNGVNYKLDTEDIYPEIALYYHMNKIYDYLAGLGLDEYTELPNHRGTNPMIGIANFQMMSYSGRNVTLLPLDNAFFSKYDPYFSEMFFGDFEYSQSDALIFGQGNRADFAYDGDVIYHEFGHGVVDGIAQFAYEGWADRYGFTNEIMGMNEGMADVFSFLITNDPCLGEYVAKISGEGEKLDGFQCLRTATNPNKVNEDFTGESHNDGLPLVGSHWEIYQKMLDDGLTKDDFARLFLTALMSVADSEIGFMEWAELMVKSAEEGFSKELAEEIREILTERNYFEEVRARDVTTKAEYYYFGGVGNPQYGLMSTNTVYIEEENGDLTEVAPMYLQLYLDVPECVDTLTVSGMPYGENYGLNPEFKALVREEKPVFWNHNSEPSTVKYDRVVESGDGSSWTFSGLEPGKRYYFHFLNTGYPGLLYNPKAKTSWTSEAECTPSGPEEADDDEEVLPDADEEASEDSDEVSDEDLSDDDTKEENKSSGCSMTVF